MAFRKPNIQAFAIYYYFWSMKKRLFLCFFLSLSLLSNAQSVENFNDGNISENPEWAGDTSKYKVDASLELQLMGSGSGRSIIYTPVATADSTVWEIYFRLGFNPSNNNQLRIYLAADSPDFLGSFNGYVLKIGETLSNDPIELESNCSRFFE